METFNEIVRYVNTALFAGLGWLTFLRWRRREDESARWAALTFGSLALVALIAILLPEHSDSGVVDYIRTLIVAVIITFPYFLYRTAGSFRPARHWFDWIALGVTMVLVLWTVLLPRIPEAGEPRPAWYQTFVLCVIVQWASLSVIVAVRFWRAGKNQPVVARRRMRMLAAASILLSVVIVMAGRGTEETQGIRLISQLMTTVSVLAFFLAFSPPHWLRQAWRRPVEESLRRATLELMTAETSDQVMGILLPHAIGIVGGEGVAVLDKEGKVVGSSGVEPAQIARSSDLHKAADGDRRDAETGLVHLEFPFGAMLVRTGPYTPFFGQEEVELLGSLGAFANLALERVAAGDLRVQLEKAQLRRQQALEINDNIVQGLAVAKYSFDLGQDEKGREAVEGTLVAARAIISELLEDLGAEMDFAPGTLTRGEAATGFMDSRLTEERRKQQVADDA